MERVRKAFLYADKKSAGRLTKHQYKVAMIAAFGCRPDSLEIRHVFRRYHPRKAITLHDFECCARRKLPPSEANHAEILFVYMDKDLHCYVSLEDLRTVCETSDVQLDFAVFERLFRELDRFRIGHVGIEEFTFLLKKVSLGK